MCCSFDLFVLELPSRTFFSGLLVSVTRTASSVLVVFVVAPPVDGAFFLYDGAK